jgi:glycosyl transferase family 25
MKKIIEYFDRGYIINLSDRIDRRQQAENEFRRVGIKLPSEKIQFYTTVRPTDKGEFQDIGTRGCFDSHRGILDLAEQDRLQNVLIFEDDVSFRDVGSAHEQQLISQLAKADWDVIFFGYLKPKDAQLTGPLINWPNDILGIHFYGVNGKFIRPMLQYMNDCELRPRDHPDGGPMPADGAYNHIRYIKKNINFYLSAPSLAHQRSSRTDIAQIHLLDEIRLLRPIMHGLRAIKHRLRMLSDRNQLRRQMVGDKDHSKPF